MSRASRRSIRAFVGIALAATLATSAGCGDDDAGDGPADSGVGSDAADLGGSPRDSGPRPDTGSPADPCSADEEGALDTVGCNGAPLGASVAANAFAGGCTADDTDQGSCATAGDVCDAVDSGGLCVRPCVSGGTYVSTGGCPMGSRCFDFGTDEGAFCYPDCATDADCVHGVCDEEGACIAPIADGCAADDEIASTVGCNGPVLGPATANALGGTCTPDADPEANPAGSCTDPDALCDFEDAAAGGICIVACEPITGTYVSTAECPAGTRCFDVGDGEGYCYADCAANADCATSVCDEDGSCVAPAGA